ncbi:unnamed protein product [Prorocentrum cordatum]|uniref:Calpain catalytic domain-containing protein n=1 Tax=Prorocentrum cordatum TaxID=2364126 RepID=A0ABN9VGK5_9DINO|nr:unnamed protein product [Polarella glacialis]
MTGLAARALRGGPGEPRGYSTAPRRLGSAGPPETDLQAGAGRPGKKAFREAGDIVQGQIGTCFLLGALGSIAGAREADVQKFFVSYDVDVGVYGVRFNVDGEWTYTIIDDVFPVDENGELLYARCKDPQEVWVPLLEKAYCKLFTCYEMCDGGQPSEAISGGFSFLGGVNGKFPVRRPDRRDPTKFFQIMQQAQSKGWLMTTGFKKQEGKSSSAGKCGEGVSENGLVCGHAYSVLRVVEGGGEQLVCCRNPWGAGEWTGKWSDANEFGEWTDEMKEITGYQGLDDGKFWMSMEDFVANTTGVDYARTFGPHWSKAGPWQGQRLAEALAALPEGARAAKVAKVKEGILKRLMAQATSASDAASAGSGAAAGAAALAAAPARPGPPAASPVAPPPSVPPPPGASAPCRAGPGGPSSVGRRVAPPPNWWRRLGPWPLDGRLRSSSP